MGIDIHNLNLLAHAQDLGVRYERTLAIGTVILGIGLMAAGHFAMIWEQSVLVALLLLILGLTPFGLPKQTVGFTDAGLEILRGDAAEVRDALIEAASLRVRLQ